MTLAERLDRFMRDFDPYEYADCDGSLEATENFLRESPEQVVDMLLNILEEMCA